MSEQSPQYQPYPDESARREQPAAPTSMEKPPSIKRAVLLMRIGAALSALYLVASLLTLQLLRDQVRERLEQRNGTLNQAEFDAAYKLGLSLLVVIGLVSIVLWLWMAAMNNRGKNWARITATVLAGLNIIFSLMSLVGSESNINTPVSVIYTVANLAIAIGALIFMYRPDASQYYAAMSRR